MLKQGFFKIILSSGLLVGTLDILAAIAKYSIPAGKDPLNVLRFIASGVFGKEAFSGGVPMAGLGLFFHYVIAIVFTGFFFFIYPKIGFLSKNRVLTGVLYGIFIWLVMNLLVLPMSRVPLSPFNLSQAIIGAIILIGAIGLPLSFIARKHFY